jgi:hypothetical protein
MNAQIQEAEAKSPAKSKPEYVSVTMNDGTVREFSVNKKTGRTQLMIKDYHLDDQGNFVSARFDFNNGEFLTVVPPSSLHGRLIGHGLMQKYGDELAGQKGADGGELEVEDAILIIDELDENIQKGEWSQRKEGSGMGGTSILLKALMIYSALPMDTAKAFLKDKDAKYKLALRHNDELAGKTGETLAQVVKRLESERAAKAAKVDTSGDLAGLIKVPTDEVPTDATE